MLGLGICFFKCFSNILTLAHAFWHLHTIVNSQLMGGWLALTASARLTCLGGWLALTSSAWLTCLPAGVSSPSVSFVPLDCVISSRRQWKKDFNDMWLYTATIHLAYETSYSAHSLRMRCVVVVVVVTVSGAIKNHCDCGASLNQCGSKVP